MGRAIAALIVYLFLTAPAGFAAVSFVGGQLSPTNLPQPATMTVPWATPLAEGPVRVLAVAPEYTKYDLVELAKRVEMKWDWVPTWSHDTLTRPGDDASSFIERFHDHLKNTDMVVLANIDFAILPQACVDSLAGHVQGGMGLFLAHVDGAVPSELRDALPTGSGTDVDAIVRGLGLTMTPERERIHESLYAGRYGEGRIVDFRTAAPPFSHSLLPEIEDVFLADEAYRETYLALMGRAVLWSARFDSEVQIVSLASTAIAGPREEEIPPDLPPEYVQAMKDSVIQPLLHPFVLRLSKAAPQRYTVRTQVRIPGRDLQLVWPQEQPVGKGDTTYGFSLPVPVGRYFLDVWLVDAGRTDRVVDWFSESILVDGWPLITEFQCSRSSVMPNDSLEVTVVVPAQLRRMEEAALAGEVLVRATDNLGRIVAEKSEVLTGEGGRFVFALDLVNLPGNRLKLEAFAADRRGAAMVEGSLFNTTYDYTYVPVAAPANRAYGLVVQGPPAVEYNMASLLGMLREHGVDGIAGPGGIDFAFLMSQENMRVLPEFRVLTPDDAQTAVCPQDAGHWQHTLARLQEEGRAYAGMGAQTFFIAAAAPGTPEHDWAGCHPCRRALQEYLHAHYRALADLNAAWGTSYTRWEDVSFPRTPGTGESWAPYVDVQRYHERTLANPYMLSQAALQETSVTARVGAVLPTQVAGAPLRDIWLFTSQLNALTVQGDLVAAEKIRSYSIPDSFTAVAHGATTLVDVNGFARWLPWHGAAHGMSASWLTEVYAGSMRTAGEALVTPELEAEAALKEVGAQLHALQAGLAEVFGASVRESYGIAIYDSPASGHVNEVMKGWYESRSDAEAAFMDVLEPLGYQYDFVADAAALTGSLVDYRVLVLPAVWAMSDEEIEVIKAFHDAGAIIIADGLPGIYNEHGRLRAGSPLAPLFGVTHSGGRTLREARDVPVTLRLGEESLQATLPVTSVDGSVQRAGSDAAPVAWQLHEGPAAALLLNHALNVETVGQVRAAVDFMLREQGFMPAAQPEMRKGGAFDGEVVHWRLGAASLTLVLRDAGASGEEKVSPNLRLDGHVYNTRTGELIRKPEKLRVTMRPGDAALFCALPYEVTRIDVQPLAAATNAGRPLRFAVEVKAEGALPGRHVVWVDLIGPDGKTLRHYGEAIWCDAGRGQASINLALNETPGNYTLRARDVLSGSTAEQPVQILPR